MTKKLTNFRLDKKDLNYIKQTAKNKNISQTKIIQDSLILYRNENQINVEIENKFIDIFYNLYNVVVPFCFGSLMTYFYLRNSWFFLLFFCIAVIPAILPIHKKDFNILAVG